LATPLWCRSDPDPPLLQIGASNDALFYGVCRPPV